MMKKVMFVLLLSFLTIDIFAAGAKDSKGNKPLEVAVEIGRAHV